MDATTHCNRRPKPIGIWTSSSVFHLESRPESGLDELLKHICGRRS